MQFPDLVARENHHRLRVRAGRDRPGAGHELAQTTHCLGRSHGTDAKADAAGCDEQGKAQIRVELCRASTERVARSVRLAMPRRISARSGPKACEVLRKSEGGHSGFLALAVGKLPIVCSPTARNRRGYE